MSKLTPAQRDLAFKILLQRKEPEAQKALYMALVKEVDAVADTFHGFNLTDAELQLRCQSAVNQVILHWWVTSISRSPKDLTDYRIQVEVKSSHVSRYFSMTYSPELQLMFSGASPVRYLILPYGQELEDMIEAEYNSL